MKIKVIVSTDGGCSYEGEVQLAPIGRKKTKSETPAKSPKLQVPIGVLILRFHLGLS